MPPKFILSKKPKEYLKQGFAHCGAYCVKGILSAFGRDNKGHPKDYHSNWFGRLTGGTQGRNYWVKVLKSYGVDAKVASAENLSDKGKLELLKQLLLNDAPVMIRMGNGYWSDKYNPILGKIIPHWITLWGYDDKKKAFFVYDSALARKHWDISLPVGNTIRTYREILRDWNYGRWQPWSWHISSQPYLYIKIDGSIHE